MSVKILGEDILENYDYIDSPKKLPWSTDIAVRFENILQTPEYVLRVENLLQNSNTRSQEEVDFMTETLTNILIDGVTLADISKTNRSLGIQKKRKSGKNKLRHPKWHDLSCGILSKCCEQKFPRM